MFQSANAFTQDLSDWDTSSLTRLYEIFYSSHANPKISNWDVSKVTNMDRVFDHRILLTRILARGTFPPLQNGYMFHNAQKFNQNLNGWDTSAFGTWRECFGMRMPSTAPLTAQRY